MALPPLQTLIARGGSAEVWRSGDLAVKVLTNERAQDSWYRVSFQREVRAAAALSHPNLLEVVDYGFDPRGRPWLACPFMEGGDLLSSCGRLEWPQLRRVLVGLLRGLAHAHARGIVHLDVKPRNVLSGLGEWKLGDFGLAHALEWDHDPSERIVGTPAYMAPEHFDGAVERYGPWTDLYSFGCLAWQLVCGRPPFLGQVRVLHQAHRSWPLPRLQPVVEVPAGLEAWLGRLLEKAPVARFRHAADAAHGLDRLSQERTQPLLTLAGVASEDVDTLDLVTEAVEITGDLPSFASTVSTLGVEAAPFPPDWRGSLEPGLLDPRRANMASLRPIPLVGREGERDRLWQLLRELEGLKVVTLDGGPGFGKSHLARWFCVRAEELGAAHTSQVSRVEPGLLQAVEEAVKDRRVVVLLDAAPAAVVRSTLQLLRGVPGRILVLLAGSPAPEADARIVLQALGDSTMRRLVRDVLGLSGHVASAVLEKAEGNPQLAVQLAASVRPRVVLTPEGWALPEGQSLELPRGLAQVWSGRLERFLSVRPESERLGLELAAAMGREVADALWRSLAEQAGLRLAPELLDDLVRAGLAQESGELWHFAHPLLREVLQQEQRAVRWHALLAEHHEEPGRRGLHWLKAGDPRAADALLSGVRGAMKEGDFGRAERLLDARSQVAAEDAPGLSIAARLAGIRGSAQQGVGLATRALELATDPEQKTRARLQGARLLASAGDPRAAHWYHEALQGAEQVQDLRLKGLTRELYGHFLLEQGRLGEGELALRRAGQDFEAAGAQEELGGVHLGLGFLALAREDGASAAEHGHDALQRARGVRAENNALALLGDAHRLLGELDRAREYFETTSERAKRAGLVYGACINELNLALIDLEQGHLGQARRRVRRFAPALEARGARLLLGLIALIEAVSAAGEGRDLELPGLLARAETVLAESGHVNRDVAWLAEELARVAPPDIAERATVLALRQREALAR